MPSYLLAISFFFFFSPKRWKRFMDSWSASLYFHSLQLLSRISAHIHKWPPSVPSAPFSAPAALAAYQHTQELFQEERCCLPHNVCVGDRSPRSGSVTRFVLCRENTARLNVIAKRVINIFFLIDDSVAMVWCRERKELFHAGSPQENEVRLPLNTASGMCSNVKFWIPQLCAAKPNRSKKASAPEEPCFYLQKGLTMKDILELWISAPFNMTVVVKQQSHPIG